MSDGFHSLCIFQSTHPVRGGTLEAIKGDLVKAISIHPPREGWDEAFWAALAVAAGFQSTHPVRGGTSCCGKRFAAPQNFNPPTP